MEIRNETSLIETEEDREDRFLRDKTKEECIVFLKKPIKERIKILENMNNDRRNYYEKNSTN